MRVAPGLEPWLDNELDELGLHGKTVPGGVELRASTEQLWLIHRDCRLVESVRARLRSFGARTFDGLVEGLKRLPWHAYLNRSVSLNVSVTCHRSRLWHSDAVAERVRMVLAPYVAGPDVANGDTTQTVFVRITGDIVQVSIDASGELMHRRGHRTFVGTAPLRETLAAALVRMVDLPLLGTPALWDPFCGSGCLALEWLDKKLGVAAGRDRLFAFEQWPIHDAAAYGQWLPGRPLPAPRPLVCFGSDIDSSVLVSAESNAKRHGLESHCNWLHGDFESFVDRIPVGACILSNPPYGSRLGDKRSYMRLMQRLEKILARRRDIRPAVILVPLPCKPWQPTLEWQPVAEFYNGGLRVQALRLGGVQSGG